jgi:Spx/MgsR family transcriptional regulator
VSITLYGIPNCDTVKKARKWLDERGIAYAFHDYKKQGADPAHVARWVAEGGWEKVLNRRGTTFRSIPAAETVNLDAAGAVPLMVAHPSSIKRPIVEYRGGLLVGFDAEAWEAALAG